jgi:hypothetical protein
MVIGGYSVVSHWWLLIAILLMVINGYCISGYCINGFGEYFIMDIGGY